MKYLHLFFNHPMRLGALVFGLWAPCAIASIPTGEFRQSDAAGVRAVRISEDGKTAVWISQMCATCAAVITAPQAVVDMGGGRLQIGNSRFQVRSAKQLSHGALGQFNKD